MLAHAWLGQRNREVVGLSSGERAIVAVPEDYEAAYNIFKATCERSVVNLSDTHRAILDAVYELSSQSTFDGFSLRKIADAAGMHHSTVAEHKTYLTKSAKLLREVEGGLDLVSDAEPSWWRKDDLLVGFARPEQVGRWWEEGGYSSPESARHARQPAGEGRDRDAYAESPVGHPTRQPPISTRQSRPEQEEGGVSGTASAVSDAKADAEKPVGKAKRDDDEPVSGVSGGFEDGDSHSVACIHGFRGGQGCYLCDPDHPYRKGGTS